MSPRYFEKFPKIKYNGYSALNLMASAKLVNRFTTNPFVYYPYELNNNPSPDVLSHQYYDDPYYTWLIYMANQVIDPYYDWYVSNYYFLKNIEAKYGSVEYSQKKIKFYRTNWYADDRQIPPSVFENSFPAAEMKYWEKKYNEDVGVLLYYYRKPMDIMTNTNKVIQLETSDASLFASGDLVDVVRNSQNVGTAEVVVADSVSLTIKNIYLTSGDILPDDIIRHDSNSAISATVVTTTLVSTNIPDAEMTYWEPVTYFDYEDEINNSKKTIKLIDNKLSNDLSKAFTDVMK